MVSSSSPSFREEFHHPASWQPAQVAAQGQQLEHSTGAGTHRGGPCPPVIPAPSPSAGTQLRRVSTCNSAPTGTPHQNAERGCSTLITTSANRNAAVTEGTHPPVPFQWCWKQGQLLGWEHHLHFAPTSFPQVPAECNRNHHRILCQAGHQCSSSSNIQIFDSFEKLEVW